MEANRDDGRDGGSNAKTKVGYTRVDRDKVVGMLKGESCCFCKRNGLVLGNFWFKKIESHKITWYISDLTKRSLVDYMLYDWETE